MNKTKKQEKLKRTYLLNKQQVREIEEMSKKLGVTYNQIVRHAIDYFYNNYNPEIDLDYLEEEIKAGEILR